jgi:thymidylate synthase (FAD)
MPAITGWSSWAPEGGTANADALAEFAGRLCYQSWDRPNAATAKNADYIRNILEHQHYSVLEHAGFTVAISVASRALTHELVRHRHLSFTQQSQRYVPAGDSSFVVPPLLRGDPEAERILREHWEASVRAYEQLAEIGAKKLAHVASKRDRRKRAREAARAVLPNMATTEICVSGNHRAWREVIEKRGSEHADAEIRELALRILEIAREVAPSIYQDFRARRIAEPDGSVIRVVERVPMHNSSSDEAQHDGVSVEHAVTPGEDR